MSHFYIRFSFIIEKARIPLSQIILKFLCATGLDFGDPFSFLLFSKNNNINAI